MMTQGVASHLSEAQINPIQINDLLARHLAGDFGDLPSEDRAENKRAIRDGNRILSAYQLGSARVWIITESDRSATTVLFPEEY